MSADQPIITKDQMAALLGRSLSPPETSNYELYLEIAILRIEDLLCLKVENFNPIPADLELLIGRCFGVISQEQSDSESHGINRKEVEDFSISYYERADSPMIEFVKLNGSIIDKYGQCQAPIRHGKVYGGDCIRCL